LRCLAGFEPEEFGIKEVLNEGLTDEDAVPEAPAEPVTKLGDIWLLGNQRLMCGDSTSIDAVEKLMAGSKADMVFTDPPYGMFLNADYSDMGGKNSMTRKSGNKYEQVIGDHNDFTPELINTIFACFDYCKEIFMWGADYYAELLPKKNEGSWVFAPFFKLRCLAGFVLPAYWVSFCHTLAFTVHIFSSLGLR